MAAKSNKKSSTENASAKTIHAKKNPKKDVKTVTINGKKYALPPTLEIWD